MNRSRFAVCLLLSLTLSSAYAAPSATSSASDDIAQTLLNAMKAENYDKAFSMFDQTMQGAVSAEKLRAIWSAQIGMYGPLVSWTITDKKQAPGMDIRIALLKFDHGALQATIAVHSDTQEVGGFLLKPAPSGKPAPPAPYVHPADFRATEISIGTAPYILGATLTEPVGLGPFPAAILIAGSGPQDRDETIGPNKVFKDLAEGLASRGIVVLRYDKRTFTYGAKLGDSISVDDEVTNDAGAALAALRARPEIDPQRIYVIGHSLGALLAPEVGSRFAPVAGVVLMAPPGRPLEDMIVAQMKYLGASPKDMADIQDKAARVKAGTLGREKFLGAPQSYFQDLARHDGIGAARKLGKPILILRGERDYQVEAVDVDAWRQGLAGAPGVEVTTVPSLNHLFIAGEGKPGPSEYDKPAHVDVRVIDKLSAFIGPPRG